MANSIRRVVNGSREDTATVLATGVEWESLRAAYWGHYQQTQLADECWQRAQEYELELNSFLKRSEKGRNFYPNLESVFRH